MTLNNRQKLFVDGVISGKSATQAYKDAGYSNNQRTAEVNAEKLLRNAEVKAAIAEARSKSAENAEVTLEWLIEQGKGILASAVNDRSHAASVAALKELGVLSGQRVEKQNNQLSDTKGNPLVPTINLTTAK